MVAYDRGPIHPRREKALTDDLEFENTAETSQDDEGTRRSGHRHSPVSQNLHALDKTVDELTNLVAVLYDRLEFVMGPEESKIDPPEEKTDVERSPLVLKLDQLRGEVYTVNRRLSVMLDRLEF